MSKTVFIGDGLTEGIPGVSYYRFLHKKEGLLCHGVRGETILGATAKVEKMLKSEKYHDVERYVIQIGLNDVLFPVLKLHSKSWKFVVDLREIRSGSQHSDDLTCFLRHYESLLVKLLASKKKIAVIGLPLMENRLLEMNTTLEEYNAAVKTLCGKYKIPFLDLRELERNSQRNKRGSYFYGKTIVGTLIDGVVTSVLPFSNAVSRMRGLSVSVDGIHLNYRMAKKLAKMIEIKFLTE